MLNELLAHIVPLGWQHINLTGDYRWYADDTFAVDGFRTLRDIDAQVVHAA
jgi:hypothetical protein